MRSPYVGRKASGYNAKRRKQRKWHRENEIVEAMLTHSIGRILDVPCGTGRFFGLYRKTRRPFVGLDVSQDMLDVALGEYPRVDVRVGDATSLPSIHFKCVVCVRLLHLIDWRTLREVMHQILAVATESVILTIQLRDKKHVTPDVITHPERAFRRLILMRGWRVAEEHRITSAGWYVMRLAPGGKL